MRHAVRALAILALLAVGAAGFALEAPGDLIEEAMEVYAWMTIWPLDADWESESAEEGWYPVLDERYRTREGLNAKLLEYFSPEIAEGLWKWELYREIGGILCRDADEGREIDGEIAEIEYEDVSIAADRIVRRAVVSYLTEDESLLTEAYEFVALWDGAAWTFTEFPFFW